MTTPARIELSENPTRSPNARAAWLAIGLALTAAAVMVAPLDLEISRASMRAQDRFGLLVQECGTHPALAIYVFAIIWLAATPLRRKVLWLSRASSAVLVQALVHTMFAVNTLKLLWGRARYASVDAGHASYSPLWELHPGSGEMSFPSGHVATALVLLPAALILWREGRRAAATAVATASMAYALVIAYGRVRLGAHYASDVLFAAGTAFLMAPASVALGDKYLGLFERASNLRKARPS